MKKAFLALILPVAVQAAIVYDNSGTILERSVQFSSGPYFEIGDEITLAGTARLATQATVQLWNDGAEGEFDLLLRFYDVGSPVGAQIGPTFTLTSLLAPAGSVINAVFTGLNVTLPDTLVFTLAVANASAGVDLGVDLFSPPVVGSSDAGYLVVNDGSFSQQGATGDANAYFVLDAADVGEVPEPAASLLVAAGLAGALALRALTKTRQ